jgi:4-hydroxy-tetrahydrodipicolinate synthase
MTRKRSDLKAWARDHLRGVENTTFPSFTSDLETLDEDGIRHDVRQGIAHGFFSTMCALETGLTVEEAKRFVEVSVDEAGDDILVTVSLILNNFDENMELLEHSEKVGADGVLLGYPPTFHPSDKEEVYDVTRRFCDATDMHVTLYPSPHFPFSRFHNSGFPLDVLDRLADLDNVVAIKVGDLGLFADAHRIAGDRVLVGCPVERYAPLLVQGFDMQWMGAGCYEVFQSPDKPYLVDYFDKLQRGEDAAAMEIYWNLAPMRNIFEEQFNKTVMTGTYNWHQQKFYQWCVGGNGGLTRQPAMKLHQWEADTIKMGFYAIGISPRDNMEEFFVGRSNWEKLHAAKSND